MSLIDPARCDIISWWRFDTKLGGGDGRYLCERFVINCCGRIGTGRSNVGGGEKIV